jgi:hypothetical protein
VRGLAITDGGEAVTVTYSVTLASDIVVSTLARLPDVTRTPSLPALRNKGISNLTSYVPGASPRT